MECLDLFAEEAKPFLLFNRSSVGATPRFTKLLVWLTHFPRLSRIGAVGLEIPDFLWPAWLEHTREQVAKGQQTRPELTPRQYLAEEMAGSAALLDRFARESRERLFEALDMYHCVAEFHVEDGSAAKRILDQQTDFVPEERAGATTTTPPLCCYAWVRRSESPTAVAASLPVSEPSVAPAVDRPLGHLRLDATTLIFEAFSKKNYALGRTRLDECLGPQLRFEKEQLTNLGQQLADRQKLWPESTSGQASGSGQESQGRPQGSEVQREAAWRTHRQHYQKVLDEALPALGGLTARAAARDATSRPKLVQWLKAQIHHIETVNVREGLDLNLDWVLEELGVLELKSASPT